MKISEIQQQALELRARNAWSDGNPDQRFRYLIAEVGELARELLRYQWPDQDRAEIDRAVGHEIYDIVWNLCDLANQLGIELEPYFDEKLQLNRSRRW
jgi:NTP pyrophosphatase (non-canonical NTP hydrolase)